MSTSVLGWITIGSLAYLAGFGVYLMAKANRWSKATFRFELGPTEVAKLRGIIDRQNQDQP